jgi:hypothetical protein
MVMRQTFFTPCKSEGNDWRRNSIFRPTCAIGGKVCRLVIDLGICENKISKKVVKKLGLETEKHPNPDKLDGIRKETKSEDRT